MYNYTKCFHGTVVRLQQLNLSTIATEIARSDGKVLTPLNYQYIVIHITRIFIKETVSFYGILEYYIVLVDSICRDSADTSSDGLVQNCVTLS